MKINRGPLAIAITTAVHTDLSKYTIQVSYKVLKDALTKRLGAEIDLIDVVNKLKKKPDSESHKATVQEEISFFKVTKNTEFLKLAKDLLVGLNAQSKTRTAIFFSCIYSCLVFSLALGNFLSR